MSTIEKVIAELALMRRELAGLVQVVSPWISSEEMRSRYGIKDPGTLAKMEQRGEIPIRSHGRWNRAEVMQWEAASNMRGAV